MCIKVFYKYHHMQSTLYIQKKLTRYTNEHFFLNYGCNYIYLSKFRSYLLKLDCTITCKIHYIYRRSSWDTQMNIFFLNYRCNCVYLSKSRTYLLKLECTHKYSKMHKVSGRIWPDLNMSPPSEHLEVWCQVWMDTDLSSPGEYLKICGQFERMWM